MNHGAKQEVGFRDKLRHTKQVALLWQRDRATLLSVEILQLTKHPI